MIFDFAELRTKVIDTFMEYGSWWKLSGMAEWLDVSNKNIKKVWDELEVEGLLERKQRG